MVNLRELFKLLHLRSSAESVLVMSTACSINDWLKQDSTSLYLYCFFCIVRMTLYKKFLRGFILVSFGMKCGTFLSYCLLIITRDTYSSSRRKKGPENCGEVKKVGEGEKES